MPSPTWIPGRPNCGGIFDFDQKKRRLVEVSGELENPDVWNDAKRAQDLGREKKLLESVVAVLEDVGSQLRDLGELFGMAREENDDEKLHAVVADLAGLRIGVGKLRELLLEVRQFPLELVVFAVGDLGPGLAVIQLGMMGHLLAQVGDPFLGLGKGHGQPPAWASPLVSSRLKCSPAGNFRGRNNDLLRLRA